MIASVTQARTRTTKAVACAVSQVMESIRNQMNAAMIVILNQEIRIAVMIEIEETDEIRATETGTGTALEEIVTGIVANLECVIEIETEIGTGTGQRLGIGMAIVRDRKLETETAIDQEGETAVDRKRATAVDLRAVIVIATGHEIVTDQGLECVIVEHQRGAIETETEIEIEIAIEGKMKKLQKKNRKSSGRLQLVHFRLKIQRQQMQKHHLLQKPLRVRLRSRRPV